MNKAAVNKTFFDFQTTALRGGEVEVPLATRAGVAVAALLRLPRVPSLLGPVSPLTVRGHALALLLGVRHDQGPLEGSSQVALLLLTKKRGTEPSLLRMLVDLRADERTGLLPLVSLVSNSQALGVHRALGFSWEPSPAEVHPDLEVSARGLRIGSELVLTLGSRGIEREAPSYALWALRGGRLARVICESDHRMTVSGAHLKLAQHGDFASRVADLVGRDTKPLLGARTRNLRSKLLAPVDLGPAR